MMHQHRLVPVLFAAFLFWYGLNIENNSLSWELKTTDKSDDNYLSGRFMSNHVFLILLNYLNAETSEAVIQLTTFFLDF